MKVDEDFEKIIKNLQKKWRMKKGENISIREITKNMAKDPALVDFENRLLNDNNIKINFRIKFDGGKR